MRHLFALLLLSLPALAIPASALSDSPEITEPTKVLRPFNGKNLDGFYTWQKDTERKDPHNVYSVQDGTIRIAGQGAGYLATKRSYKNYHLSVEYRWGDKTDGSGNVRNSGILLHGSGPDGSAGGTWMASLEVQLAQGCEGDFIVIRGNDEKGDKIPVDISCKTVLASDKRTRWSPSGEPTAYSGRQFWWSKHQPGFKEKVDTRGKDDVASPFGKWTKVECICRANKVTIKINGTTVNECYNVFPQAGKILLQNESNEVFFRNMEIRPLQSE